MYHPTEGRRAESTCELGARFTEELWADLTEIPEVKDCRLCRHSGLDFAGRSGLRIRELSKLELTGQMGNSAGRYEMTGALGAGAGGGQYMMLTPLTGLARRSSLDSVVCCGASSVDILVEGLFVSPLALCV